MIQILLISSDELRELPEGAILTSVRPGDRLVWSRAFARPHPDPETGLWRLPRNPFAEWQVQEIEAELPEVIDSAVLLGDEAWLSTLHDPHDTTGSH